MTRRCVASGGGAPARSGPGFEARNHRNATRLWVRMRRNADIDPSDVKQLAPGELPLTIGNGCLLCRQRRTGVLPRKHRLARASSTRSQN
jgi:hypothetical protein